MTKRKSLIAYSLFTILMLSMLLSNIYMVFAAITVTSPGQLGDMSHYNGIVFDGFVAHKSDIEGAIAVGGEAHLGVTGQYDIGASYNKYNSTVTIGVYQNPNNYPSLLVNDHFKVGKSSGQSYINIYGGPVVINGNQEGNLNLTGLWSSKGIQYATPAIVDAFFADSYKTARRVSSAMLQANETAVTASQLKTSSNFSTPADFVNKYMDTAGLAKNKVLAVNVIDSGHVTVSEPKIPSSWGNYEVIIFNFPNASSVTFSGGSLYVGGSGINTSAPAGAWPGQHALLDQYASKVIWNMPEANTVHISGAGVVGSVLAPEADVFGNGGSINGMLIANFFEQNGGMELHAFKFNKNVFDFTAKGDPGSIRVVKKNDSTDALLPGAEFKLEIDDGGVWKEVKLVQTDTSNGNGIYMPDENGTEILATSAIGSFTVIGLEQADYRLVETKAPEGYLLDPTPYLFTIDEDNGVYEVLKIEIKNTKETLPPGDVIVIEKRDENGDPLEGAKFLLYRWMPVGGDDSGVYEAVEIPLDPPLVSDSAGKVHLPPLEEGIYYLGELEAPEDYAIDLDAQILRIQVKYDKGSGQWSYDYKNWTHGKDQATNWPYVDNSGSDPIYYFINTEDTSGTFYHTIILSKIDHDNPSIPISGAKFELYFLDGPTPDVPVRAGTTDAFGRIYFTSLAEGRYRIVEVETPNGYSLIDTNGWLNGAYEFALPDALITPGIPGEGDLPGGGMPPQGSPLAPALAQKDTGEDTAQEESSSQDNTTETGVFQEDDNSAQQEQAEPAPDAADDEQAGFEAGEEDVQQDSAEEENESDDAIEEDPSTDREPVQQETSASMELPAQPSVSARMDNTGFNIWYEEEAGDSEAMLYSKLREEDFALGDPVIQEVENNTPPQDGTDDTTEPGESPNQQPVDETDAESDVQTGEEEPANPAEEQGGQPQESEPATGQEAEETKEEDEKIHQPAETPDESGSRVQAADGLLDFDGLNDPQNPVPPIQPVADPPSPLAYSIIYFHLTCENKRNVGTIEIEKKDANTGAFLQGAVFELHQMSFGGSVVVRENLVTDDAGKITITDLPYGNYWVAEVQAPAGYKSEPMPKLANLFEDNQNGIVTVQFENEPLQAQVKFIKKDGITQNPLQGAVYNLYYYDRGFRQWVLHPTYNTAFSSNANGEVGPFQLSVGAYKLVEIQAPDGYDLDMEFGANETIFAVSLSDYTNNTQIIELDDIKLINYPHMARGMVSVLKADSRSRSTALSGAVFNLYTYEDNGSGSINPNDYEYQIYRRGLTTGPNGVLVIEDLKPGDYALYEVLAPNGYEVEKNMADRIIQFRIEEDPNAPDQVLEVEPIVVLNSPETPGNPDPDKPTGPGPSGSGDSGGGGGSNQRDKYPNDRIPDDPDPQPKETGEVSEELIETTTVDEYGMPTGWISGNDNPDTGQLQSNIYLLVSLWLLVTGAFIFRMRKLDD